MRIGIVGLGLIGGSLAKALKAYTGHEVLVSNRTAATAQAAVAAGDADGLLTDEALPGAEIVFVCLYPGATVAYVREKAALFAKGALVVDCSGVKTPVCEPLFPVARAHGFVFVGGHPMAGREYSGFKYARDDLFDHASMILCGHGDDDPAVLQRARDFFMELGFLRVQFTTPKTHDEMIAYTSQLAHVVSSAYVKCPLADKHRGFSAGSFADMTRVARLNEDMWTELFFDNREALLPVVEDLVQRVTEYRDALRDEDREGMRKLLREGRETKERLTD